MLIDSIFLSDKLGAYKSEGIVSTPKPGIISSDQTAVTGKNGWIYLYKGTNSYYETYFDQDKAALGEQWVNVIEKRQKYFNEKNIMHLHIIIPNKASILPEFYPFELPRKETSILSKILANKNEKIFCPLYKWRDAIIKQSVFRQNDTHLTIAGNAYLTEEIISLLGLSKEINTLVETSQVENIGDLGSKFTPGIPEFYKAPSFTSGMLDQRYIDKIFEFIPGSGLNGTSQSFKNNSPLYKKKLLIFGNSFFEKSPSWGMTPFFAALFGETHFVWSPNIDCETIDRVKPDIVLYQTCERFLSRIPSDT